ncbi:EscU/YscU/HrcU family type III secretion system export apparatus switch protein [uncultured Tateyamaria sp.]|uniref:EscU/YscU/HrcU family type III secretion system export apparatus switch protein n=1 Tax=uncultured Tateyamaria sp. TaxID=455651 RepID=UPI00262EC008|nr:EscU/YscU/HrcU family type III secretion system export apparatus switch protein [uncultured Tateyamaria sp.]
MSDTEAKTKDASPRKLRKLRQEGTVANSTETAGFMAAAIGVVVMIAIFGGAIGSLSGMFEVTATAMAQPFEDAVRAASADIAWRLFKIVAPVAGAAVLIAILVAILFNGGLPISAKPLAPQLERISPKAGLTRIYGRRGWIETAASFTRIFIWLIFVGIVALIWLPPFAGAVQCGFSCQLNMSRPALWLLGIGFVVILVLSAGADMILQKSLFLFEQMMTESEVKQERKEAFGDPGIRAERRRRMRGETTDAKAAGVDKANICFFAGDRAVAIRYHPQQAQTPRISAKLQGQAVGQFKDKLNGVGLPVVESDRMVSGCWGIEPGGAMPSDLYETFATTLREAMT